MQAKLKIGPKTGRRRRTGRAYAAGCFSFGDFMLEALAASLEKGPYGKPYLAEYPEIHFNISHSGEWAVCALASMPCGVDIQERRSIRSRRMVERTMNAREQRQIQEAEDGTGEFIKLWTYKESCIKLSGEGFHQDMKTLKEPACHQFFWLEKDLAGCVAGEESFTLEIRIEMPENHYH